MGRARFRQERAMIEQSQFTPFHKSLLRKLESVTQLSAEEKQAIMGLPFIAREFRADKDIVSIGDKPAECCVLIDGWACRYKVTRSGARQIMSFHIAGDMPDLQSLFLKTMDHSVGTITPVTVAFIQHRDMSELLQRYEGIARALWRDSLVEAAIFREWMVGIGRRSAHQRIAHLLCEMAAKLRSVELNEGHTYPWPVTQQEVSDALGLSDVHVNRVIRDLRRDGLVVVRRGSFIVKDWDGLEKLGEFDPLYLHIHQQAA
jgi:CRP-like cAMP-binding protein